MFLQRRATNSVGGCAHSEGKVCLFFQASKSVTSPFNTSEVFWPPNVVVGPASTDRRGPLRLHHSVRARARRNKTHTMSGSAPPSAPPPDAPVAEQQFPVALILLVSATAAILLLLLMAACCTALRFEPCGLLPERMMELSKERKAPRKATKNSERNKKMAPARKSNGMTDGRDPPARAASKPAVNSSTSGAGVGVGVSSSSSLVVDKETPGTTSAAATPQRPGLHREKSWYERSMEQKKAGTAERDAPAPGVAQTPSHPGLKHQASWYGQKLERRCSQGLLPVATMDTPTSTPARAQDERRASVVGAPATPLRASPDGGEAGAGAETVAAAASAQRASTSTPGPPLSSTTLAPAGSTTGDATSRLRAHFGAPPATPTTTLSDWQARCQRSFERKASSPCLGAGTVTVPQLPQAVPTPVGDAKPTPAASSSSSTASVPPSASPAAGAQPRPFGRSDSWYGAKLERRHSLGSMPAAQAQAADGKTAPPAGDVSAAAPRRTVAVPPTVPPLAELSVVHARSWEEEKQEAPGDAASAAGSSSAASLPKPIRTRLLPAGRNKDRAAPVPPAAAPPAAAPAAPFADPVRMTRVDLPPTAATPFPPEQPPSVSMPTPPTSAPPRAPPAAQAVQPAVALSPAVPTHTTSSTNELRRAEAQAARAQAEAERQKAEARASARQAELARLEAAALRQELGRFKESLGVGEGKAASPAPPPSMASALSMGDKGSRAAPTADPGAQRRNPIAGTNAGATAAVLAACTGPRAHVHPPALVSPQTTMLSSPGPTGPTAQGASRPASRPASAGKLAGRRTPGSSKPRAPGRTSSIVDVAQI